METFPTALKYVGSVTEVLEWNITTQVRVFVH